jgi:diguanylate cyclase (GGDEF)-like protein
MPIVLILLVCFYSCRVSASGPVTRFSHLFVAQGLSQNTIVSGVQDNQGFLWFASKDGLNRYDGFDFKVYRHDVNDINSISSNDIHALYRDQAGVLWIGTDSGLNKYDEHTNSFTHLKHKDEKYLSLSENSVNVIVQDAAGNLWLGTNSGLSKYDSGRNEFTHFAHVAGDSHSLSANHITALHKGIDGNLWVGTTRGLNSLDTQTGRFTRLSHRTKGPDQANYNNIKALYQDPNNTLWVASAAGLHTLNQQQQTFVPFKHNKQVPLDLRNVSVNNLTPDRKGALWIGSANGLYRYHAKQDTLTQFIHNAEDSQSLSHNTVYSIFEDNSAMIWIGTERGLNKYAGNSQGFVHFKQQGSDPTSLNHNNVRSILQDKHQTLWLGTDAGLNRFDKNSQTFTHFSHQSSKPNSLSHNHVVALFESTTDELWVATHGGGLNRFNRKTANFEHFRFDPNDPNSISSDNIKSLYQDNQGTLWIGTHDNGLNKFDATTGKFIRFVHNSLNPLSISSNTVTAIYQDNSDLLWIGTQGGGINQFDPKSGQFIRFRHLKNDNRSLSHDDVRAIYQDALGTLWIATYGGGLNKYDSHTFSFQHYRDPTQKANYIYGILGGDQGDLWLSTNQGLAEFDPQKKTYQHFDRFDGLQGNQFSDGAYFQSNSGELFFGGNNGFNRFYAKDINLAPQSDNLVFTDLLLFNQPVAIDSSRLNREKSTFTLARAINATTQLTLSALHSPISFQFSALNFNNPMKDKYAYMLQGLDSDWIYTKANNRRATYTNIPAGDYVLHIKASNQSGIWSTQTKSIKIKVLPSSWQSWWAYTLYLICFSGLTFGFVHLVRNKLSFERSVNFDLRQQIAKRTIALEHAQESIKKSSLTDQLTGAHNRHFFNSFISQELATLQRQHFNPDRGLQPDFGFVLIDINNFHHINNTYGHDAGDTVLIQLAEILRQSSRNTDWLIRWNDEQFLILGRFLRREEMKILLDRIHQDVAKQTFDLGNKLTTQLTCSIGATAFPFFSDEFTALTWQQTLHLSELALYTVKNNGHNAWLCLCENEQSQQQNFYQQAVSDLQQMVKDKQVSFVTSFPDKPLNF